MGTSARGESFSSCSGSRPLNHKYVFREVEEKTGPSRPCPPGTSAARSTHGHLAWGTTRTASCSIVNPAR